MSNGSWYVNEWDSEWTNYSSCSRIQGMRRLQYFHIVTYAVSMLFLIPSLFIFVNYNASINRSRENADVMSSVEAYSCLELLSPTHGSVTMCAAGDH
ncbi:hypothetical protein CEXT_324271 [Caerostris extrusa]|uniref:Uncharacterized protein n=1 Tax=Caerostris extrusa TaxID=172846 RepID=A0AAV4TC06_CAEEX|nr:hypothetical protein CEXT_324271 [Caerostris extrusa]